MSYNRRLPVYLLLDCSESMAGEAFTAMSGGLASMIGELRQNPLALETAAISVITFASKVQQMMPLTDLITFRPPVLRMGSGTALGAVLDLLEQCMTREIVPSKPDQKGDYKPIVFIMTDGDPTDSWEAQADRFRTNISGKKANVIAIAVGPDADTRKLQRITDTVLVMRGTEPESFKVFFKWISASVSTSSQKLEIPGEKGIDLPPLPAESIEVARPNEVHEPYEPDRLVFLHSRCVKSRLFYLIRYAKRYESRGIGFLTTGKPFYEALAAHLVDNFDFESGTGDAPKISADQLQGAVPCPSCGNTYWAMCPNGHVHCCPPIQNNIVLICPWCNVTAQYAAGSFDVGRGRG